MSQIDAEEGERHHIGERGEFLPKKKNVTPFNNSRVQLVLDLCRKMNILNSAVHH